MTPEASPNVHREPVSTAFSGKAAALVESREKFRQGSAQVRPADSPISTSRTRDRTGELTAGFVGSPRADGIAFFAAFRRP